MAEKLSTRQALFTGYVAQLIVYAGTRGFALTFGETYRPQEMQELYYRQGKTRTKSSKHTQRLAVDFNVFQEGEYLTGKAGYDVLGAYWKTLDPRNRWGGDWTTLKDYNHFEMT